jgi:hypothetical protein
MPKMGCKFNPNIKFPQVLFAKFIKPINLFILKAKAVLLETKVRCDFMLKKLSILLVLALIGFSACRKENRIISSNFSLRYSSDTVFLDTLFTEIGSSTYELKVYNDSKETVNIPTIRLKNPGSPFRLNINGTASTSLNNVEILAEDSIYIFIEVTAAEIANQNTMIVSDQIVFDLAEGASEVELVSLAKNAIFHFPSNFIVLGSGNNRSVIPYSIIDCNTVWDNSMPHVIYGYAVVDSGCTLEIASGADIHFHENSGLWVFSDGILKIATNAQPGQGDSVTFSGDRLEPFYEEVPGQWGGVLGGLYIGQGGKAEINNLVIKNASNGLRCDSAIFPDQLKITNSYILNSSRTALYSGFGNIEAENLVIANQGLYGFYAFGGNYNFKHCSFVNYWNLSTRQEPTVVLSNFLEFQDASGQIQRITRSLESAYFGNCIIDGINEQELQFVKDDGAMFNYQFNHAQLKLNNDLTERGFSVSEVNFINVLVNNSADFVNPALNNYQLDSLSQMVDQGNTSDGFIVPTDILGLSRNFNGLPDLGAYERQF